MPSLVKYFRWNKAPKMLSIKVPKNAVKVTNATPWYPNCGKASQADKNPPANPYDDLARLRKILPQDLEQLAKDRSNNLYEALIKAGVSKDQLKVSDKIQKIKAKMELYIGLGIAIEVKK